MINCATLKFMIFGRPFCGIFMSSLLPLPLPPLRTPCFGGIVVMNILLRIFSAWCRGNFFPLGYNKIKHWEAIQFTYYWVTQTPVRSYHQLPIVGERRVIHHRYGNFSPPTRKKCVNNRPNYDVFSLSSLMQLIYFTRGERECRAIN